MSPMRRGARIYDRPGPCLKQQKICIFWQPQSHHVARVDMHSSCPCNELLGIRNRVLMEVPPTDPAVLQEAYSVARSMARWIGPKSPWTPDRWVTRYSGLKRRNYENAIIDLGADPFKRQDRNISAFVKLEKLLDATKDPRIIQCRGPRFNLELGNFLKAIEDRLYNVQGTGRMKRWLPTGRLIAKGLNMTKRAKLIISKFDQTPRCVVYSLDCSRFDAHVSQEMLRVEHSVYNRVFRSKHLKRILKMQLVNNCYTTSGMHYVCPGGRMSGDMNTALGNCVLMVIMLAVIMKRLGFTPSMWQMLDDGDDCLLFIQQTHEPMMVGLAEQFLKFGHVIKLENRATTIQEITFCQSSIINTVVGPKCVQNPVRTMSRALTGPRHWPDREFRKRYLGLVGWCELALSMGVPVVQSLAMLFIRSSGGELPRSPVYYDRQWMAKREARHKVQPVEVTAEARCTFWEAFGITPDEQIALENQFDTSILDWDGVQERHDPRAAAPPAGPSWRTPKASRSSIKRAKKRAQRKRFFYLDYPTEEEASAEQHGYRWWDRVVSDFQSVYRGSYTAGIAENLTDPPGPISWDTLFHIQRALHAPSGVVDTIRNLYHHCRNNWGQGDTPSN